LNHSFQVLEYDTPEELLSNEGSAFSRMVQSTGPTNAQYLCSLALGGKENKSSREDTKQRRWLASSRWAAATQFALVVSLTSSEDDLQIPHMEDENNILKKTKDAVITLQGVLEGRHDRIIDETLNEYQVPTDTWWSALYKIVEGTVTLHLGT
jgi:ATP-binding cassette subfamily C (CFTR/MRP) protein 1